ncbi:unnamed protein product [Rhizophagus irregularis]|nr:unnamed protein product [Rhizophagus irregularis]
MADFEKISIDINNDKDSIYDIINKIEIKTDINNEKDINYEKDINNEKDVDINKPRIDKPIIAVSPNEIYIVTYNPKDHSIVGWIDKDKEKEQLTEDITTEIKIQDNCYIDHICVSDDKKLACIVHKGNRCYPKIIDIHLDQEIELDLITDNSIYEWNVDTKQDIKIFYNKELEENKSHYSIQELKNNFRQNSNQKYSYDTPRHAIMIEPTKSTYKFDDEQTSLSLSPVASSLTHNNLKRKIEDGQSDFEELSLLFDESNEDNLVENINENVLEQETILPCTSDSSKIRPKNIDANIIEAFHNYQNTIPKTRKVITPAYWRILNLTGESLYDCKQLSEEDISQLSQEFSDDIS